MYEPYPSLEIKDPNNIVSTTHYPELNLILYKLKKGPLWTGEEDKYLYVYNGSHGCSHHKDVYNVFWTQDSEWGICTECGTQFPPIENLHMSSHLKEFSGDKGPFFRLAEAYIWNKVLTQEELIEIQNGFNK